MTFRIANAGTAFGQGLYVVGDAAPLGAWSPAAGAALAIQGSGANAPWSGAVTLPAGTTLRYKYVRFDPQSGQAAWEGDQPTAGGNCELRVPDACGSPFARDDGSFRL